MKKKVQIGYRKKQKIKKPHCANPSKSWVISAKQGDCLQVRLKTNGSLNISFAPVQTVNLGLSRNYRNEGRNPTSADRIPIIQARDNAKITTGDSSSINQGNIFVQLLWSKRIIGGMIIAIISKIIYFFSKK